MRREGLPTADPCGVAISGAPRLLVDEGSQHTGNNDMAITSTYMEEATIYRRVGNAVMAVSPNLGFA